MAAARHAAEVEVIERITVELPPATRRIGGPRLGQDDGDALGQARAFEMVDRLKLPLLDRFAVAQDRKAQSGPARFRTT